MFFIKGQSTLTPSFISYGNWLAMVRLFCSIAKQRINLQISSQSHFSRKALNISGNAWVCRKTQQLKLRGSVGINFQLLYKPDSKRNERGKVIPMGLIKVCGQLRLPPRNADITIAGAHICYTTICHMVYDI